MAPTRPLLLALTLALLGPTAYAQAPLTLPTTVTTTILAPISAKNNGDLAFGSIIAPVAGTVTIAPDGSATPSAGITLSAAKPTSPLIVALSASPLSPFSFAVTYTSGSTIVMDGPLGATINVDTPVVTLAGVTTPLDVGKNAYLGTTDGAGGCEIRLGATMNLAANQQPGMYTGSYSVTLAYE